MTPAEKFSKILKTYKILTLDDKLDCLLLVVDNYGEHYVINGDYYLKQLDITSYIIHPKHNVNIYKKAEYVGRIVTCLDRTKYNDILNQWRKENGLLEDEDENEDLSDIINEIFK